MSTQTFTSTDATAAAAPSTSLQIDYPTIRREIGVLMGFGPDPNNWSSNQIQDGTDIINRGLRQFYSPPSVRQDGKIHEWRFMRPVTTLSTVAGYSTGTVTIASGVVTLSGGTFPSWAADGDVKVSGVTYSVATRDSGTQVTLDDTSVTAAAGTAYSIEQSAYDLPSTFAALDGPLTYRPGTSNLYPPIEIVSEDQIRVRQQDDVYTSYRPLKAALRPKAFDATVGQRWQLVFWPTPDDVYELSYRYKAAPNPLNDSNLYPLGGIEHSETILSSILSIAETKLDDEMGVHHSRFMQCLGASIQHDLDSTAPESLGYNGDPSIVRDTDASDYAWSSANNVTYQGHTLYEG